MVLIKQNKKEQNLENQIGHMFLSTNYLEKSKDSY